MCDRGVLGGRSSIRWKRRRRECWRVTRRIVGIEALFTFATERLAEPPASRERFVVGRVVQRSTDDTGRAVAPTSLRSLEAATHRGLHTVGWPMQQSVPSPIRAVILSVAKNLVGSRRSVLHQILRFAQDDPLRERGFWNRFERRCQAHSAWGWSRRGSYERRWIWLKPPRPRPKRP